MIGYNPVTQSLEVSMGRLKNKLKNFTVGFVSSVAVASFLLGYTTAIAYLNETGHFLGVVFLGILGFGLFSGLFYAWITD
jgi:hypothetical protein